MEPKDLKNSNEELKITPQEPETVENQNEQSAPEVSENNEPVAELETAEIVEAPVETGLVEVAEPEVESEPVAEAKTDSEVLVEEKPVREKVDYSGKTEVELINALRELVHSDEDYEEVKEEVDEIKFAFYKLHHAEVENQKKAFYAEHVPEEEFVEVENVYDNDLKNLLEEFRLQKTEYNKKLEEEKENNLVLKYQIIEEIKALINNKESINKTFQEFRELQNRWREVGLVPQAKLKDLWETYHHHVENFYDYIKINKELRDLDLKKNLEAKI